MLEEQPATPAICSNVRSTPEVGDDDLAFFDRQRLQLAGGLLRIDGPGCSCRIVSNQGAAQDAAAVSWRSAARAACPASMAPLRTTRNSQAAGFSGGVAGLPASETRSGPRLRVRHTTAARKLQRGGVLVQKITEQAWIHAASASRSTNVSL